MAEVDYQREVTRLALDSLAGGGFALAGSGAIREHGIIDRPTQDIDLFTSVTSPQAFAESTKRLANAMRERGFEVEEDRNAGCDRFIWPRQDGYFRPHFMTRRAPVAVICGPTFNVGFITGWMRRKAGLDGVESGVVRADSKGRPG